MCGGTRLCSAPIRLHLHTLNRVVEIHNRWSRGRVVRIDCNKWRLADGCLRKLSGRLPTVNLFDVFFFVCLFRWIKGAYRLISCSRTRAYSLGPQRDFFFESFVRHCGFYWLSSATNESSTTSPWYPFAKKKKKTRLPTPAQPTGTAGCGCCLAADFYLLQLNSIQLLNDECIVLCVFIIIYLFV